MDQDIFKEASKYKPHHMPFYLRFLLVLIAILIVYLPQAYFTYKDLQNQSQQQKVKNLSELENTPDLVPTEIPTPTIVKKIIRKQALPIQKEVETPGEWGIAKQIDKYTWTMKVADDERMATPQEILEALNVYRQRYGRGTLSWDDKLGAYAQTRAEYFTKRGSTDAHAGFTDFLNNQDGFNKLGFYGLGENSSFGYKLLGVHLIEWIFAADEGHNNNQLNSEWTHVGIGVNGVAVELIFGGKKI